MKIQELRVGNIVIDKGEICKIIKIEASGCVVASKGNDTFLSSIKDLEPLQLDEDILIKTGFEKYSAKERKRFELKYKEIAPNYDLNGFYIYKTDKRYLCYKNGQMGEFVFYHNESYVNLRYLHQLQNIYFDLTGEELEISKLKQFKN